MAADHTLLSGDAVRDVAQLTREALGKTVEINGITYSTTPLFDVRKTEPVPSGIGVTTLQSFAEFAQNEDEEYREGRGLFVHVEAPDSVDLYTGIFGEFHQRVRLAGAEAILPKLRLEFWLDPESFVIELLTRYQATEGREAVFALVGNLQDEAVQTFADDGVSQVATAKKGVTKVAHVAVPNPVTLRPYRTFPEVEQVESPFILRLRGGGGGLPPTCALFECDGGRWRIEAIARVKAWLAENLEGIPIYG